MTALASQGQLRASIIRWSLFTVPLCLLLGFLSGMVAGSGPGNAWFDGLVKPAIYPPPATFGIVWSILYVMMGFALALVCAAWGARGRTAAIVAFAVQFAINLAWSPVFFALHQITAALVVIGVLALTVVLFWRVRRAAGLLLLPYLAWVLFASALNWQFLQANPGADGSSGEAAVQRYEI
ncbi:MAG: tryptophan-rich sensory protein [Sphingomonadales bacterium]|nr:tryptophan-rich sensory protein [Sphingomonadales bacterium]MBD3774747.1 tryptophan-rich sensory protein [Paracoccaceae bacterium]